ncbi:hypothetical protein Dcar01_02632 [Deinococcus carri]|uniref:HEAT repeat domain-containing protein n=1 Tax=Deinococcus carri TaxID=1211323 RepID=A0ABP9W958_9DEIO
MTVPENPESNRQLVAQYLVGNDDANIARLTELARDEPGVAEQLVQIIDADENEEVPAGAIRALGFARPALLEQPFTRMLGSNDVTQRATAARLSGTFGVTALKTAVEQQLGTDPSANVRYWCALTLGMIGDMSSLPVLEGHTQDEAWGDHQDTVAGAARSAILEITERASP